MPNAMDTEYVGRLLFSYIKGRLNMNDKTFQTVNCTAIGKVRMSHPIFRRLRTRKSMYQWIPVGHNWTKYNLDTDKFPCCNANDKTYEHLSQCQHEDLKEVCRVAFITIQKSCNDTKFPLHFTCAFLQVI